MWYWAGCSSDGMYFCITTAASACEETYGLYEEDINFVRWPSAMTVGPLGFGSGPSIAFHVPSFSQCAQIFDRCLTSRVQDGSSTANPNIAMRICYNPTFSGGNSDFNGNFATGDTVCQQVVRTRPGHAMGQRRHLTALSGF